MGRRKRAQSDDYDDSIERRFFAGKSKDTEERKKPAAKMELNIPCTKSDHSPEDIERQRQKKRAKKQRQKEKKAAQKAAEEEEAANRKRQKEALQVEKSKKKRRKEIEKKEPHLNEFVKTHKGVKYCDIALGTGPVIQDRKKVRVKYVLRAENKTGKIIDQSGNFGFRMGKNEGTCFGFNLACLNHHSKTRFKF